MEGRAIGMKVGSASRHYLLLTFNTDMARGSSITPSNNNTPFLGYLAVLMYVCLFRFPIVAALASFYIEIDFVGNWTDARRGVFQSAANR